LSTSHPRARSKWNHLLSIENSSVPSNSTLPRSFCSAVENMEDTIGLAMNIVPREGIAEHLHSQIHTLEFGIVDLAMNYLLFEDNAYLPAITTNPLYTSFGEYKAQY